MLVLRYAPILNSAIAALVKQVIAWQVMDMDVMVSNVQESCCKA